MIDALCLAPDYSQEFPELFSASPPRITCGQNLSEDVVWATAIDWVAANRTFILRAGAIVLENGLMDRDDLLQTAHIIAVQQCQRVLREGKLEEFVPLFFGHLRGTCLSEWQQSHLVRAVELDWDNVPDPNPVDITAVCDGIDPRVEREKAMTEALEFMSERQQNVMKALLGMEEGRGGLGIREAAAWFEVDHKTIHETVERACCRVAQRKVVQRKSAYREPREDQLRSRLVQLEKQNAALLKENLSLRRQLGRPVISG